MALSPADRINIKKRIAQTLGQQSYRDIDLTLSEFGLPTSDDWRGDTATDYVAEMLYGSVPDEAIAHLDSYLHPSQVPAALPQAESFQDSASPWSGSDFRLFLSHVHEYREHAGALREELARRSIDAFVAHDAIEPTAEWQDVIVYALKSCHGCAALLTPGFRESQWADQEVGFCMARNLLVIPIEFGLTPYGFLGKYQALPVKKGASQVDIALAIFELLIRKRQSRDAMARALVSRWTATDSFAGARENYSFLRMIPKAVWTRALVNDVWDACERNEQLRDANINWKPAETAITELFAELPFERPRPPEPATATDDDIPF